MIEKREHLVEIVIDTTQQVPPDRVFVSAPEDEDTDVVDVFGAPIFVRRISSRESIP